MGHIPQSGDAPLPLAVSFHQQGIQSWMRMISGREVGRAEDDAWAPFAPALLVGSLSKCSSSDDGGWAESRKTPMRKIRMDVLA